jgi:hypothetical protein
VGICESPPPLFFSPSFFFFLLPFSFFFFSLTASNDSHLTTSSRFTYNDSIWLCDKLEEFQLEWDKRTDLTPRAYGKVKLDPEIKNIRSFGKRAYTNELNAQRTVITDLLGGKLPRYPLVSAVN